MGSIEVRDAVHGLIELDPRRWSVVDTAPFQRLRGIQQLALTHLVYPGARHSRFEHCIGASHIAGRLADRVNRRDGLPVQGERVRLAALVHDIGHGPFSHVSEEVFEFLTGRENVHEAISAAIVTKHPGVRNAIGEEDSQWIADLLLHEGHARRRTVERDVVSGPADIDKLDYLLRDSHYCGVNYGRYDIDKLIESAVAVEEGFNESALAFDISGIYALEEMLLARFHMTRQVYGHKTRAGIDIMLIRAMLKGIEEGVLPKDVFSPPVDMSEDYVKDYIKWDDASLRKALVTSNADSTARKLMVALSERRIMKRIVQFSFQDLTEKFGRGSAGYMAKPDASVLSQHRAQAEYDIAAALGTDPHWVALDWDSASSHTARRWAAKVEGKEIIIRDERSQNLLFHDVSEVFRRADVAENNRVLVYARSKDGDPLSAEIIRKAQETILRGIEAIGRASAQV